MPIPLCDIPRFKPGASQAVSLTFDGDTYQPAKDSPPACALVDAPSGTYTAIVSLNAYWTLDDTPEALERAATFHWTSP